MGSATAQPMLILWLVVVARWGWQSVCLVAMAKFKITMRSPSVQVPLVTYLNSIAHGFNRSDQLSFLDLDNANNCNERLTGSLKHFS